MGTDVTQMDEKTLVWAFASEVYPSGMTFASSVHVKDLGAVMREVRVWCITNRWELSIRLVVDDASCWAYTVEIDPVDESSMFHQLVYVVEKDLRIALLRAAVLAARAMKGQSHD